MNEKPTRRLGVAAGLLVIVLAGQTSRAGTFSTFTFAGDGDSGISSTKTYTHAIDVNGGTPTVNGVLFAAGGLSGGNYSFSMPSPSTFSGHSAGATGNINALLSNFIYSGDSTSADVTETLQLTGLTPGTTYVTTFYNSAFGSAGGRSQDISASDGGFITFDQNFASLSGLQYTFVAGGTSITYTFVANGINASFHQYGFTNEVVPVPEPAHLLFVAVGGLALFGLARRRFAAAA